MQIGAPAWNDEFECRRCDVLYLDIPDSARTSRGGRKIAIGPGPVVANLASRPLRSRAGCPGAGRAPKVVRNIAGGQRLRACPKCLRVIADADLRAGKVPAHAAREAA